MMPFEAVLCHIRLNLSLVCWLQVLLQVLAAPLQSQPPANMPRKAAK